MTRYRLRAGAQFSIDGPGGGYIAPSFDRDYAADDPFVVASPESFEPVPGAEPVARRPSAVSKRLPGRPPLTEARVRADLERALASLAAEGRTRPSWEALAARHDGLTEFGLTVGALRKRRDQFPALFREIVPDLPE
jgi:hypothetical protein